MLFRYDFQTIIILVPCLIFSLVFHEFAHAYAAYKLGDSTAKSMGRLTLNPIPHLDLLGGVMVLLVGFGWAKPVPVNPNNLNQPEKDMMSIAAAGPIANLVLAFLGGLIVQTLPENNLFSVVCLVFTQINTALAVFNLIPLPPLDGSQILTGIFIRRNPQFIYKLHQYGPKILFAIIIFGSIANVSIIWWFIGPIVQFLTSFFIGHSF